MTEIRYIDSKTGLPNCFEFIIHSADNSHAKSNDTAGFFIDLFEKNDDFRCEKEPSTLIWSRHYKCFYLDIPFTMVYDEDYDICTFSLSEEYMQHREKIAEEIKKLTEI